MIQNPLIEHWEKLGFTAVISWEGESPAAIDFKLYKITDIWNGNPVWERLDKDCYNTNKLEEARVYLDGFIKWDGCSNWRFVQQTNVMLHFCSLKEMQNISDVFTRCWTMTEDLLPRFEGDSGR